jgi:hypothetical protein
MFTIGGLAGIDVGEFGGLSDIFESCKSERRAGALPFELERRLMGVTGSCDDSGGTASGNSLANIPLRELPHPFDVLSSSLSRGGMGLFCAKVRLISTSLTLMLRRLVCFDEEGVISLNSFATGVVIGESSFPGMFTTTIELLSDSWLSLTGCFPGRILGRGFKRLEVEREGTPTSPNTSEAEVRISLLGTGGTGGGKESGKVEDTDATGVLGKEPLIVRLMTDVRIPKRPSNGEHNKSLTDRSRTVVCPHILPRNAVVLALTEDFAI